MADNTHKYGFRYVKSLNGNSSTGSPPRMRCRLASAYQPTAGGSNCNLHAGDVVTFTTDGTIIMGVGSEGTQTANLGVVDGFGPVYDGTVMQPASYFVGGSGVYGTNLDNATYVYVIPLEGNVFEVDCDDAVTATTKAAYTAFIDENVDMVLVRNTSNANDYSADPKLDISSHSPNTTTLQFRIVDLSQQLGIDYSGANVPLYVTVNKSAQAPYNTTGI